MKRSPLMRKTPLKSNKPMARGTTRLKQHKPKSAKPKRAARERQDKHLADLCHGQPCYLLLPVVACSARDTVVPAHSNQMKHGKGKGIKAHHTFTVPGCAACHAELDQGMRLTKEQKFALWDDAYARWEPVRTQLIDQ
jgi:hypothetical protein